MSEETKEGAAPAASEKATPAAPAAPTLAAIPRSLQQIQQEYMKTVQELGNITWQIEILRNQKQGLYAKLNDLGIEASKLPPPPPAPKLAAVPPPPKAGSDGTA